MRVIKKGNTYDEHTWAITCRVCSSELEVVPGDVWRRQYSGDQRDPRNRSQDFLQCACAVCGAQCTVENWSDVPEVVRRMQLGGVKTNPQGAQ